MFSSLSGITTHCPRPPKVEHARVISQNKEFLSGESVNYECLEHYTSDGELSIMCNDGKWEESTINCKRTYIHKHFTN